MHVEDICMQCNTVYCTLNDKHVEDVGDDKNTYYVDFWTSNDWFMGGACSLDLISQNQRCRALSTWGRKDSRLRFWLSTLPASTISLILPLCFFHVDSVDWLMLNPLQTSTAFKPLSNLPSISIFSFSVLSVCWRLGFDTDILNANTQIERNTGVFIWFWMHLFLMSKITSKIHERKHLFLIQNVEDVEDGRKTTFKTWKTSKTSKITSKIHGRKHLFLIQNVEDGRKTTYNTWKTLTVASFLNSK